MKTYPRELRHKVKATANITNNNKIRVITEYPEGTRSYEASAGGGDRMRQALAVKEETRKRRMTPTHVKDLWRSELLPMKKQRKSIL